MLQELVEIKTENTPTFQVMLLSNDASKGVEVHEEKEVNFPRIQRHLQNGGSVFITSKPSQKIPAPATQNKPQRRRTARTVTAFCFNHV
jgi:hypothetical protein